MHTQQNHSTVIDLNQPMAKRRRSMFTLPYMLYFGCWVLILTSLMIILLQLRYKSFVKQHKYEYDLQHSDVASLVVLGSVPVNIHMVHSSKVELTVTAKWAGQFKVTFAKDNKYVSVLKVEVEELESRPLLYLGSSSVPTAVNLFIPIEHSSSMNLIIGTEMRLVTVPDIGPLQFRSINIDSIGSINIDSIEATGGEVRILAPNIRVRQITSTGAVKLEAESEVNASVDSLESVSIVAKRFDGRVKTLGGNIAVEARESATISLVDFDGSFDVSCKRRVKIQSGTVQPTFVTFTNTKAKGHMLPPDPEMLSPSLSMTSAGLCTVKLVSAII